MSDERSKAWEMLDRAFRQYLEAPDATNAGMLAILAARREVCKEA